MRSQVIYVSPGTEVVLYYDGKQERRTVIAVQGTDIILFPPQPPLFWWPRLVSALAVVLAVCAWVKGGLLP